MDGEEIIAPLKFAYLERPVAALDFSYYSGPGRQHSRIMNYRSDTPIYDKPVYSTYNLTIMIEYIYANEMVNDPEIAELYKIFRECVFNNCKTIMLHIPWNDTTEAPPPPPPLPPAPLDKVTTEPCQFAEVLDVLCKCSNWHDFWDVLNQYRELGLLTYGRRSDFGDGTECYVAVVDKRKVIDILYYDGEMFKVVGSDVRYSDLREKYRGMTQVWIRGRR